MTNEQWKQLTDVIKGETLSPLPVGFIIDSPWLPDWYEYNPMWPYLRLWNDFVRRASFINSHGHTVPEVLLISPMDSVWALSGPGVFDPAYPGRVPAPPVLPASPPASGIPRQCSTSTNGLGPRSSRTS